MKAWFGRVGPRRKKVRPAESGQEIIERNLIGDIDRGHAQAPLVLVAMKKIVISHRKVEQVPRRNAGRIVIVIFCPGCRNGDAR